MKVKESALKADIVHKLFLDCLFKEDELVVRGVVVEGIIINVVFHPDRLKAARERVKNLLEELPDAFRETKGGGWSFLNMCMDKYNHQWTGMHSTQEELCLLGMGLGLLECQIPRKMWSVLPGGVPYFVYKDKNNG